MHTYLVERYLPGTPVPDVIAAAARAKSAADDLRADGTAVRYLDSTFVPEEDSCFCTFEAVSAEIVRRVNDQAGFSYARILRAVRLPLRSNSQVRLRTVRGHSGENTEDVNRIREKG
jgi:ABC-type microcin C transport system permease subunit YejB